MPMVPLEVKPRLTVFGVHTISDAQSETNWRFVEQDSRGEYWQFWNGDLIAVRVKPVAEYWWE